MKPTFRMEMEVLFKNEDFTNTDDTFIPNIYKFKVYIVYVR